MTKVSMENVYDGKRMLEELKKYMEGRKDSHAVFDTDSLCILIYDDEKKLVYEIDVENCTTAAQILDWIYQLYHKTWVTPVILRDIIECMNIVFLRIFSKGVQGMICPFGHGLHKGEDIRKAMRKYCLANKKGTIQDGPSG